MSASQPATFNLQEFTDVGQLLVGGRLYTYAYGTTAQKIAYTDPDGTVPHTYTADGAGGQYIALNARGELPAPLYLVAGSYDISLKRSDGSTVWTRKADGVDSAASALASALADSDGSSRMGYMQMGAGAIARWVLDKLRERVSVIDFEGCDPTGATESTSAWKKAEARMALLGGGRVRVPNGSYMLKNYEVTNPRVIFEGETGGFTYERITDVTKVGVRLFPSPDATWVIRFKGTSTGAAAQGSGLRNAVIIDTARGARRARIRPDRRLRRHDP